jgi:hypothetical protein
MPRYEIKGSQISVAYGTDAMTGVFLSVYDSRLKYNETASEEVNSIASRIGAGDGGGCYFDLHTGMGGFGHKVSLNTINTFMVRYGVEQSQANSLCGGMIGGGAGKGGSGVGSGRGGGGQGSGGKGKGSGGSAGDGRGGGVGGVSGGEGAGKGAGSGSSDVINGLKTVGRRKFVDVAVTMFWECLLRDMYPEKDTEKIFGVEMIRSETPRNVEKFWMGKLTYSVWRGLFLPGKISKVGMTVALLQGKMPEYFEKCAREQDSEIKQQENKGKYLPELLRRGFHDIPWDQEIHRLCALKK